MINEEDKKRIRLMTRIAMYEKTEGKDNEPVARYFRSDYIGLKVLGAICCATLVFGIIIGLYVLCNSEILLNDFYSIDLMEMARKLILYYIGFVVVYIIIVALVFFVKYNKAVKYKRIFSKNLKKLLYHYSRKEENSGYENDRHND